MKFCSSAFLPRQVIERHEFAKRRRAVIVDQNIDVAECSNDGFNDAQRNRRLGGNPPVWQNLGAGLRCNPLRCGAQILLPGAQ